MANKKTAKGISAGTVAIAGIGAAAAAAAGAYWFYGSPDATKHRKTAQSWMIKARAEVLEAIETAIQEAGVMDKDTYSKIVEGVLARYSKLSGVTSAQMSQVTRDMKDTWQHMQKAHTKATSKSPKRARSTGSKKRR